MPKVLRLAPGGGVLLLVVEFTLDIFRRGKSNSLYHSLLNKKLTSNVPNSKHSERHTCEHTRLIERQALWSCKGSEAVHHPPICSLESPIGREIVYSKDKDVTRTYSESTSALQMEQNRF